MAQVRVSDMSEKNILSKEVKLKKVTYPTKKTMNFVVDKEAENNKKSLILFGVFLVLLALFTKFGVIDYLSKTSSLESAYNTSNEQIATLNEELKDYDSISEQYNSLVGSFLSDSEKFCLNRTDILKMIDEDVLPYVSITNITITDEKVNVYTSLTDLTTVSKVVDVLQKDDRTTYVTVSSTVADGDNSGKVSATIEITCKNEGGNE